MSESLSGYLERVLALVRVRLGEPTPSGMPMSGCHLNEIEARLLLAAAQSTLDRLRRTAE